MWYARGHVCCCFGAGLCVLSGEVKKKKAKLIVKKVKKKKTLFPPGIEPGTLRV